MIIFGAKGLAKEILEVCLEKEDRDNIVFYDDVSKDLPTKLYNEFRIIRTIDDVKNYFDDVDNRFVIGIGGPSLREFAFNKLIENGGVPITLISQHTNVGSFGVEIGEGTNVMLRSVITNDVKIGKGVLVNQLTSIGHDVTIGNFVEICPGVAISGKCVVGDLTFLGTNCSILPNINIGRHVVIGAGSVINRDVPDGSTVVGVPGKVIKTNYYTIN